MTIREQPEPARIIVLLNNYDMRESKRLIDVEADAGLPEERGTAVGADGEGQREQNRGQRDEEQQRRQHVQRGLQETGEPGDRPGRRRGGSGGVGSSVEGDRAGVVLGRDWSVPDFIDTDLDCQIG